MLVLVCAWQPVGDLFNHREERLANIATTSDLEGEAFVFYAVRALDAGEEATLTYGRRRGAAGEPSNGALLLDYGFTVPFSRSDEVRLQLRSRSLTHPDEVDIRLTLHPDHAYELARFEPAHVLRAIEARLAEYPTTLSADERALAAPLPPPHDEGRWRARHAREALAGEKRVLRHWRRQLLALDPHVDASNDGGEVRTVETSGGSAPSAFSNASTASRGLAGESTAAADEASEDVPWRFYATALSWELPRRRSDVILEVGRDNDALGRPTTAATAAAAATTGVGGGASPRRGVYVAEGSLHFGDLIGCYGGSLLSSAAQQAKLESLQGDTAFERYIFWVNSSHTLDPTDDSGRVERPFRWEMALVNEPEVSLPNAYPFYDQYGKCRDRQGLAGVPYFAVRDIAVGEEVTVCYGPTYRRDYTSVCGDGELLGRWSALQVELLRPQLRRVRDVPVSRRHVP